MLDEVKVDISKVRKVVDEQQQEFVSMKQQITKVKSSVNEREELLKLIVSFPSLKKI